MDTVTMKLYEGLFLLDSVEATADWQGTIGAVERVLERAGAEIVTIKKWDERKLAYELKKKSRGTYVLVYFNCDPLKITGIERDVQLSEIILRIMILSTERMSTEDIEKLTPAGVAEQAVAKAEEAAKEAEAAKAAEEAAKVAEAEKAAEPAPEAEEVAPEQQDESDQAPPVEDAPAVEDTTQESTEEETTEDQDAK